MKTERRRSSRPTCCDTSDPGSIVLMHDGGGDQHATIGALPMIIKGIRKMGLDLTTIPRES